MNRYQWLEELHRTYYDTLVRLARLRLKQRGASVEDAEDIVQQAFLLAAQKDISGHAAPAQWLMKTVANLCMSGAARQRKAKRLQQRLIRRRMDSSPVRSAYAVETQPDATAEQEVQLLIEQTLTPEEWELMRRYIRQDASVDELAAQYGMTPVALRVRIFRLRGKLRKAYYGL